MSNLLLWAAFWVLLVIFIAALLVRGTKRRVMKEKQMHPYRVSHEEEVAQERRAGQH
jgi:uncharacterized membrane protein